MFQTLCSTPSVYCFQFSQQQTLQCLYFLPCLTVEEIGAGKSGEPRDLAGDRNSVLLGSIIYCPSTTQFHFLTWLWRWVLFCTSSYPILLDSPWVTFDSVWFVFAISIHSHGPLPAPPPHTHFVLFSRRSLGCISKVNVILLPLWWQKRHGLQREVSAAISMPTHWSRLRWIGEAAKNSLQILVLWVVAAALWHCTTAMAARSRHPVFPVISLEHKSLLASLVAQTVKNLPAI